MLSRWWHHGRHRSPSAGTDHRRSTAQLLEGCDGVENHCGSGPFSQAQAVGRVLGVRPQKWATQDRHRMKEVARVSGAFLPPSARPACLVAAVEQGLSSSYTSPPKSVLRPTFGTKHVRHGDLLVPSSSKHDVRQHYRGSLSCSLAGVNHGLYAKWYPRTSDQGSLGRRAWSALG